MLSPSDWKSDWQRAATALLTGSRTKIDAFTDGLQVISDASSFLELFASVGGDVGC